MINQKIAEQLNSLLHEAAKKLGLVKYSINVNLNVLMGDGFLGDFYKASISDDETGDIFYLVVKAAPTDVLRRQDASSEQIYKNEIFFYSTINPTFRKFEQEHQVAKPFATIPEYIASNSEAGAEAIVFKDLTKENYVLREKDLLLNDEHAKLIFKTYGHFHSLSFCLKEQKPEEFQELVKPLFNVWRSMERKSSFMDVLGQLLQKALEGLDPSKDEPVIKKFKKYVDNAEQIYGEFVNYKGQYYGILHGDCWSNNMMFQYQDSENNSSPEALKLLDFQMVMPGSPVHDLSYFFYTGGSKQLFDNLENYLDIYYESFSESAIRLGCDPNRLLPREILSQEWRKYARIGMMLSIILTKVKLISKEDSIEIIENAKENSEDSTKFLETPYDEKLFLQRVRDILVHMHEIDAL